MGCAAALPMVKLRSLSKTKNEKSGKEREIEGREKQFLVDKTEQQTPRHPNRHLSSLLVLVHTYIHPSNIRAPDPFVGALCYVLPLGCGMCLFLDMRASYPQSQYSRFPYKYEECERGRGVTAIKKGVRATTPFSFYK